MAQSRAMSLLLALLIHNAVAPGRREAPPPRHSSALAVVAQRAVRPRPRPQSQVDWGALDVSLAPGARHERRRRDASARETLWNGVPVRIIDGQVHGIW